MPGRSIAVGKFQGLKKALTRSPLDIGAISQKKPSDVAIEADCQTDACVHLCL